MQILLGMDVWIDGQWCSHSQTGMMKEIPSSLYIADMLMCAFMYEWIRVWVCAFNFLSHFMPFLLVQIYDRNLLVKWIKMAIERDHTHTHHLNRKMHYGPIQFLHTIQMGVKVYNYCGLNWIEACQNCIWCAWVCLGVPFSLSDASNILTFIIISMVVLLFPCDQFK